MIYCVEDDTNIQELVLYALRTAGYEVEGFFDATALEVGLKNKIPSLILLDIMLPEKDGLTILEELRKNERTKNIPIILITAKSSEYDKIKGLDLGADDYITKPIAIMEMIARIKALLRRSRVDELEMDKSILQIGDLSINKKTRIIKRNEEEVTLSYREYELFLFLLENKGIVFNREELLSKVWGYSYGGESRTVDVHIRTLRQKIGDNGAIIQTVRNVGYKIGETK